VFEVYQCEVNKYEFPDDEVEVRKGLRERRGVNT
jgi:hypothetical protein